MTYSREQAVNFWFEFDAAFNPEFHDPDPATQLELAGEGFIIECFRNNYDESLGLDEQQFRGALLNASPSIKKSIKDLAEHQLRIMNHNFDMNELKIAFQDFAQGVLYDKDHDKFRLSRYNGKYFRVHLMDGIGVYQRWHIFVKAAVIAGADPNIWIEINRFIALAFAIQSEIRPKQSWEFIGSTDGRDGEIPKNQRPDGPGSPEIVKMFEPEFKSKTFQELDDTFGIKTRLD